MKNLDKLVVYFLLVILLPFSAHASEKVIKVSGSSTVSVSPDIAKFSFAISERGSNLVSTKKSIDKKSSKVVSFCNKLGIKSKDISSSEVSIHPQYNYQTREFLGYEISRVIKVTLKELEKYSDLVNGSIESGITNISNITLDTIKRDELELKALEAASDLARKKAQALAQSNGVTLGKVLSIEEIGIPSEETMYLYSERKQATVFQESGNFERGEILISATVIIQYAIK